MSTSFIKTYLLFGMVQQQLTVVVMLVEIVQKRREKLLLNNLTIKKNKYTSTNIEQICVKGIGIGK